MLRCPCGHYDDQHIRLDATRTKCLGNNRECQCDAFSIVGNAPEGTDIYREDFSCPADSNECLIRRKCTNKCGAKDEPGPGYHLAKIEKGQLGELSKVQEEVDELVDAEAQGASIMALSEASDLIGALQHWLARHHPSTSLDDLVKMAELTERAFQSGRRK